MSLLLRFVSGKRKGQEVRLPESGRFLAGRGLQADLVIEDLMVSRIHFEISCSPDGFLIEDQKSRNGTYLNGERIKQARLKPGDIVQVGDARLEFSPEEEETSGGLGATLVSKMPADGLSVISAVDDDHRAAKDLAMIYRVGNIISGERDMKVLCPLILDSVLEVLGADSGALLLEDERTGKLEEAAVRGRAKSALAYSHTIVEECYKTGVCVATHDALADERFSDAQSVFQAGIHAALCAPVQTNDRIIGAIYLDARGSSTEFQRRDLELVGAIARQAGIAIHNARLREKDIEHERLEREIEIAGNVQRRFLPQTAPEIPGYTIAAGSIPSMKVGGDYYDFICHDGSKLVMVVADVSGHGLAPALLMAELRATLRVRLAGDRPLPEVLQELNTTLIEDMPSGEFVTFLAASLDVQRGELVYVSAGHDPAAIIRPGNDEVELLDSTAPPLGILEDIEFPAADGVQLNPGDVLLLYTDGLWEAGSDMGKPLGKERMFQLAKELASRDPDEMLKQLMNAAIAQSGGAPHDDITAIVLKRT